MNANAQDDDVLIESSSSGPATPMGPSNPETPRSLLECEARNTPPPSASGSSSASRQSQAVSIGSGGQPHSFASVHPQQQQQQSQSKYGQLLAVIEDMGKDIRPTYAGSKTSAERLKRGLMHARILVRECLMECDKAART